MEFLMANLPIIICALVGVLLVIVEVFMPGFGLPGIAGVLLLAVSIVLTWTSFGPYAGLGATLLVIAVGGIAATFSFRSATKGKLSRSPLILKDKTEIPDEGDAKRRLVGKVGFAVTALRPAGTVEIDGERLNVVSRNEFVAQNASVVVDEVEGSRIVVKPVEGAFHND